MTEPLILGFLGDGGKTFSPGFNGFLDRLAQKYGVIRFADSGRDYNAVIAAIKKQPADRPIIGLGYSLGAWGPIWTAKYMERALPAHRWRLIVGLDPAGRIAGLIGGLPAASSYPVGANVRRCICIRNSLPIFPSSWAFGGGKYVAGPLGPQIELHETWMDHFSIQFSHKWQSFIESAVSSVLMVP